MRRSVRRLALRGPDLVLMARHPRWTGIDPGHNTLLAVECDGPISPQRIAAALDRFLDVCPWPAARLRRPFPWGKLHWAAGPRDRLIPPPVRVGTIAGREQLDRELAAELNTPIEPRREGPLRVALLQGEASPAAASALVLTWFHPLMDARGGQNLLAHLDHLDRHQGTSPWGAAPPAFVPDGNSRSLSARARLGGQSLRYMRTLAPVPPVSPGSSAVPPGRSRFRRTTFVRPRLAAGDPRDTREFPWRLALVGKAMADLWQKRQLPAVPFLLPVSVDLRPKGDPGPTFGNQLAFHFARFHPADTGDPAGLARALRRQMADAVREGHIEANEVAMEFLQYRPLAGMLRVLPWTGTGELFSFNCADLADWPPALAQCFGRRVVNAYHIPVVPPRPGIGVFFSRCGDHDNLIVSWLEGVVNEAEVTGIVEVIRDAMGWIPAP